MVDFSQQFVPNAIHYCWFGGSPLGELEAKCIDSWKQFLPDWEIIRWDETNYDIVTCPRYVREAYLAEKWAFVSDYARFDILYKHGGIYFDTDVEVIRPLDDIIERGPFMGCETDGTNIPWELLAERTGRACKTPQNALGILANPGLGLLAYPGLGFYKEMLDSYADDRFINDDGTYNEKTVVIRMTEMLIGHGLRNKTGIQQIDGIWVYPSDYFNPKDFDTGEIVISDNTRTIHHFSMSWFSPADKLGHDWCAVLMHRGWSNAAARLTAKCFRQDRSFMSGTQNFQVGHRKFSCSARHAA